MKYAYNYLEAVIIRTSIKYAQKWMVS